jgi:hypothetical protein
MFINTMVIASSNGATGQTKLKSPVSTIIKNTIENECDRSFLSAGYYALFILLIGAGCNKAFLLFGIAQFRK